MQYNRRDSLVVTDRIGRTGRFPEHRSSIGGRVACGAIPVRFDATAVPEAQKLTVTLANSPCKALRKPTFPHLKQLALRPASVVGLVKVVLK